MLHALAQGTRVTHRQLVARGLSTSEAANLIAYLTRLPIGDHAWTLAEVNVLLFLQSLREAGGFGQNDGLPSPTAQDRGRRTGRSRTKVTSKPRAAKRPRAAKADL